MAEGKGAEEARRDGGPIPCGGGGWEPSGSAGDDDLRRTMAVNAGRTLQSVKEAKERSRRTMRSPGSRRPRRRGRGRSADARILDGSRWPEVILCR
jgi:hypothetical protein